MKTRFVFSMLLVVAAMNTYAFCGFFVAKAGANLYNKSSQVILVRDGQRTIVTMSNDFKGDVKDFAMVVPVPVVLQEKDIKVVDGSIFQRLDEHTAPRLAEYYDHNPCAPNVLEFSMGMESAAQRLTTVDMVLEKHEDLGVTIEAQYQIGEYDILILSATESEGLKTWLTQNDYSIPAQAEEVLEPYIKNDMKFFVVKVNLEQKEARNFEELSPIQISYESSKFMLPIRLGMANAEDTQDLTVYAFTRNGRVECTNYRTVEMPTDREVPEFVEPNFSKFYVDVFNKQYDYNQQRGVFLEYAWDLSAQQAVKCDPCPTPPLVIQDIDQTGVNWLTRNGNWGGYAGNMFITRLHVRYDRKNFPQDLRFQETPNRNRFQCRYVIRHPAGGDFSCDEGIDYLEELVDRRKQELQEVSFLANWDISGNENYVAPYAKQLRIKQANEEQKKKGEILVVPGLEQPKPPYSLILILASLLFLSGLAWMMKPDVRVNLTRFHH